MKRISFFPVLCLCAVAFSSCKDRFNESGAEGRAISFSATAGFPSLLTKTQYSGEVTSDGGINYERINWTAGDKIAILSPEAMIYDQSATPWVPAPTSTNPPFSRAEYSISGTVTPDGRYSRAGIVGTGSGGILHWGSGEHRFYGVYPSSYVEFTTNLNGAAADITVSIPKNQGPASGVAPAVSTSGGVTGTHVYPDMRNAWMYSAQYAPESDKPVQLFFSPMVTAFQISVRGLDATEVPLTRFELLSQRCGLQGPFVARVQASGVVDDTHLDRMTVSYSGGLDNRVAGENDAVWFTLPEGTVVSSTKELTFTLFTYPRGTYAHPDYLDGLSLRCVSGGTTRELKLMDKDKNNWVQFPAGRKINIKGITLPEQVSPWTFSVTAEDWEEELSDVVVSPVQMTEFETEEGGILDGSMVLDLVHPSDISHKGGVSTYGKVQSYHSLDGGATKTSVPWVVDGIYATEEDALAGQNPLSNSFVSKVETPDDLNPNAAYYNRLTITYSASSGALTRDTGEEIDAWLMAQAEKGSPSACQNLANPANPGSYEIAESANTYIVNAPGYYRLPLVVGNGIKNNQVNNARFTDGLQKSENIITDIFDYTLTSYWDYLGNRIGNGFTSVTPNPWLHKTSTGTGTPTSAFVVWEDVDGLIEVADADYNLPAGAVTSPDGGTTYWLNFHIPSSAIRQGNAVLAVADGNGDVMWSWLIWVTNYVPNRVEVAENTGNKVDAKDVGQDVVMDYFMNYPTDREKYPWTGRTLMARNLGWVEHVKHYRHAAEGVWLRIRQDVGGGKVAAMRVFRDEKIVKENLGRQPYFQGGRKDAMQPVQMGESVPVPVYGKYGGSARRLDDAANVGMGYLIQHPEVFHTGTRRFYANVVQNQAAEGALWGVNLGYNSSSYTYNRVVHKTIYDPSPAGYTLSDWGLYRGFGYSITTYPYINGDAYGGIQSAYAWVEGEFEDGFWFYGREHNYGEASIFYPATGYITQNGDVVSGRTKTLYWTYRAYGFSFGNAFEFDENSINQKTLRMKAGINEGYPRNCGAAIRPIRARE